MALENVEKQVAANGRAEANRIGKEAKKQADAILAESRAEAEKIKTKMLENARQQADRLRQRALSAANLEVKKARLNAEKDVLALAHDRFLNALREMPQDRRETALTKLVSKGGFPGGKVYASEQDAELVRKLSNLEYGGNIDCIGGLTIENEDGSISLVYTFDTIAEEVWTANNKKIYDILFS